MSLSNNHLVTGFCSCVRFACASYYLPLVVLFFSGFFSGSSSGVYHHSGALALFAVIPFQGVTALLLGLIPFQGVRPYFSYALTQAVVCPTVFLNWFSIFDRRHLSSIGFRFSIDAIYRSFRGISHASAPLG